MSPLPPSSVPSLFPSQLVWERAVLEQTLRHFRHHALPYETGGVSALTFACVRAMLRVAHRLSVPRAVGLLPEYAGPVPTLGFLALDPDRLQVPSRAAVFSAPVTRLVLDEVFLDNDWTQVRPVYEPVVSSQERVDVEELAEVIAQSPELAYAVDLLVSLAELGQPFSDEAAQQVWQREVEARHPQAQRVQLHTPVRLP